MQTRHAVAILTLGLAAATGAGVWVMGGGEPAEIPVKPRLTPPPTVVAQQPPPRVAPDLDNWTPENNPIVIRSPEPPSEQVGDREARLAQSREDFVRRFDTDGDGQLNEQEREAVRAAFRDRGGNDRQLIMRRFDTDGDGELSEAERQVAREKLQEVREGIMARVVPQYDLDGDGQLNEQEREAARPAFQAEFERLRTIATLDLDNSGAVEQDELARALIGVTDGDESLDLNRDGVVDYRDATYATEVAQIRD